MTDQWVPGPPPAPTQPPAGLPPTDTWVGAEPCSTDSSGGLTSIIDNITITGAPGAITSIANGQALWSIVLNDGTSSADFRIDRYQAGTMVDSPVTIARADGTVTFADPVMLGEDPVAPLQAATKEYVDNQVAQAGIGEFLPLAGGTLTGPLTLNADPTANLQATTKQYADTKLSDAPSDSQYYTRRNAAWAISPGGMTDAPNDGTLYGRKSAAWAHLTHNDITDWTATLAPYALTANVPVGSAATPAMDGTAAAGAATAWSRGDHVHPTDTSRYAASNPSGYQTAPQVTATLAPYALTANVPVASSTTPAMDGTAAVGASAAWARGDHVHPTDTSRAPAAALANYLPLTGGTLTGILTVNASPVTFSVTTSGVSTNGNITVNGYTCRAGVSGATTSNAHNIDFVGGVSHLWIDATNSGQIAFTSDYRIKKDVIDLPGMWDTVKALRPIKYTQAEFSPPSHKEISDAPLIVADNIERWGFIAHELQATMVVSAATGVKDAPDIIQSPNPFTLIAALTKALQEAMARIEALEAAR
jgi:hypothetical protein